jgi:hypothetical protein
MKKYLLVTMPDNSIWSIPTRLIAENRNDYYIKVRGENAADVEAETEKLFADDYEVIDWAVNNMDWSDVADEAVLAKRAKTDYQEGWLEGDKELIS